MAKEIAEEFQFYQQQLQAVTIQKETLKLQDFEIESALEELEKSEEKEAFKIVGSIMIRKSVEDLKKELKERKEDIELRIRSLEKSEERILNKLKELQDLAKGG